MAEGARAPRLGVGLSTAPVGRVQRRLALGAAAVSALCLLAIAPYARLDLWRAPAFTAAYAAALCMIDLITAAVLFVQFYRLRTAALLVLASGYLFCSLIAVVFMLAFPGVFGDEGVLGGGPQSSAWLYVFWRGLFPMFVFAYALLAGRKGEIRGGRLAPWRSMAAAIGVTIVLTLAIGYVSTHDEAFLPTIMVRGDYHRTLALGLSPGLLIFVILAFVAMWRRRQTSVLDLWIIVVLCAWFCDVSLSAVVDSHRYDVGWYAGRAYGLLAASFVLVGLLAELNALYGQLEDTLDTAERQNAELIRSREELGRVQRLEALVQLTGGVAHDFNNLLTAIIGGLDIIRRKPDDPVRVSRLADNAAKAAARGAELIKRMLSFARRHDLKPAVLNPNTILLEFEGMATRAAGEAVSVELDLERGLYPVRVDATEFQAAVLNLITNARDAMADGGPLRIESRNLDLETGDPLLGLDLPAGAYVRISVVDQGEGMDAQTLERVFEPFFTTKEPGRGTGLGLSQVYGFARDAGGRVDIASAPKEGATVSLLLPRSTESAAPEPVSDAAPPLRHALDGETVLVVEDDGDVILTVHESLIDLGYTVLLAANADEALAILRRQATRVDILFSDVVMPGGMNGVQLAVEARRLRPRLKVLLTSGYAETVLRDHDIPDNTPLLSKPYQREDLAHKIRLVLGA
ncbi:MAG TPA: MASE4 domain-containing protein [Caulobacteraceae bacterium]|jgi:signal transduction histidine kinase/CheY-like chemotaxis protein|nr:MASE4 domain-containing protein [Caulobacteraceae bacterium]